MPANQIFWPIIAKNPGGGWIGFQVLHLIVQQQRLRGGPRKVVSIAEITGIESGEIQYQEIFVFKQIGVSEEGKAIGYHTATGTRPMRLDHLKASGEEVADEIFEPNPEPAHDKLY